MTSLDNIIIDNPNVNMRELMFTTAVIAAAARTYPIEES